jgi:hypothetical protein
VPGKELQKDAVKVTPAQATMPHTGSFQRRSDASFEAVYGGHICSVVGEAVVATAVGFLVGVGVGLLGRKVGISVGESVGLKVTPWKLDPEMIAFPEQSPKPRHPSAIV